MEMKPPDVAIAPRNPIQPAPTIELVKLKVAPDRDDPDDDGGGVDWSVDGLSRGHDSTSAVRNNISFSAAELISPSSPSTQS